MKYLSILFVILTISCAQKHNSNNLCNQLKEGTFYFYDSTNEYLILRDKKLQTEVNLQTGDTTYWKINWINACEFDFSFLKSSKVLSTQMEDFFKSYISVVKIVEVKQEYYLFEYSASIQGQPTILRDTGWFKRKTR